MKVANKPNVKAPRFRRSVEGTLNQAFVKAIREKISACKDLSNDEIKEIVSTFNTNIWNSVIETRDGVELPEQLGHIFIGTCNPKKTIIDFKTSAEHALIIAHRNWESDNYLAKIFYTAYGTRYRFKNHELWGFNPSRKFTRQVGQTYPKLWKQYIMIDPTKRISRLYRNEKVRMDKQEVEKDIMQTYNEFDL